MTWPTGLVATHLDAGTLPERKANNSGTDTIPTHSEYEDHGERPFPMVKTCVGRQSAGET